MLNKLTKGKTEITIQSKPIEIATEEEMDAILLDDTNLNKVYLFTGDSTSKYVNGDMYVAGEDPMPVKGDLITIADAPTGAQLYRVIKVNSDSVEVLGMDEINTSITFGSNNTYENSNIDTYLNTTWYNTLSTEMKNAIIAKTFTQDSWYWDDSGDPDYNGMYGETVPPTSTYTVSLGNASYKSAITRNVYALSCQDVIDYLKVEPVVEAASSTLQNYNLWKMYYNTDTQPSPYYYHWLRSADADYSFYAFSVNGYNGDLNGDFVSDSCAARPAFTIDLSKVSWSKA